MAMRRRKLPGGNIFLKLRNHKHCGRFDEQMALILLTLECLAAYYPLPGRSTSGALAPFTIDVVGSSFNWSAGDIRYSKCRFGGSGYLNTGSSSYRLVHRVLLQIGKASTPAGQNIRINTNIRVANLRINGTNSPIERFYQFSGC